MGDNEKNKNRSLSKRRSSSDIASNVVDYVVDNVVKPAIVGSEAIIGTLNQIRKDPTIRKIIDIMEIINRD